MTVMDAKVPAPARDVVPAEPAAMLSRDPGERLAALFDEGTLELLDRPSPAGPAAGDENSGVLAGTGLIHGIGAVAFASDPRVQGGAMGSAGCAAIVAAYDEALRRGAPVIGLWHSGGARLAEGVASLHAVGTIFAAMTAASGRVPQISVVLGPAAGGAAARRGGREPHTRRSGVVHLVTTTDAEALDRARQIAALFSDQGKIAEEAEDRDLSGLLPDSPRRAYDVHLLTGKLLDSPGVELHPRWAPNIVTILGRLAGRTVGVVASNPMRLGGCPGAPAAAEA